MTLGERLRATIFQLSVVGLGMSGVLTLGGLIILQWWALESELRSTLQAGLELGGPPAAQVVTLRPGLTLEQRSALGRTDLRWFEGFRRFAAAPVSEAHGAEGPYLVASTTLWGALADVLIFLLVYLPGAGLLALLAHRRVDAVVAEALRPLQTASASAERLAEQTLSGMMRGEFLPAIDDGEVGRFVTVVNQLLSDVRHKRARERRFTANAAHELRTPLAAMRTQVEITLRRPRSALEYRQVIEEFGEQVDELVQIVETLLELARVGDGALELRSPASAGELLREAAGRPITVTSEVAVCVNPRLLRAAITNLIQNAERYAGGVTGIFVERRGAGAAMVIEDAGPGVADMERAFEPFQRLGAPDSAGAGLGLALVREVARAHRGDAFMEARPGGGIRVGIWLPAADSPTDQGA